MEEEKVKNHLKNSPSKTYLYFKLLKILITKESRLKETITLCSHSN